MTRPTREQVDASLARTEALTWSERDIIILAAEVCALREERVTLQTAVKAFAATIARVEALVGQWGFRIGRPKWAQAADELEAVLKGET